MTASMATTNDVPFLSQMSHVLTEGPADEDVLLGAYLMTHIRPYCENCGTLETPQWRKGWFSEVLNRSVFLCNACGIKYQKNQFCPYCKFIYGKQYKTSNVWQVCSTCGRCVHVECENNYGNGQLLDPGVSYLCPECRKHSHSSHTHPSLSS